MADNDPMPVAPELPNYNAAAPGAPVPVPPTPVTVMMVAWTGTYIDLGIGRSRGKRCTAYDGGSGDER